MMSVRMRVARLERLQSGPVIRGIAKQLNAALQRWREYPVGVRCRQREFVEQIEAALREGRPVSPLAERMLSAIRRVERLHSE
jgi:hypothetical protein